MQIKDNLYMELTLGLVLTALAAFLLAGCGGGSGSAIEARPQTITFSAIPTLNLLGTTTVSATAGSGAAVSYSSITPDICSVNSLTGIVTDLTLGTCIIAANQSGNTTFAPAPQATQNIPVIFEPDQTISFDAAPTLRLFSTAIVSATASSGLAVSYGSATPDICSVDSSSGLVTALTLGDCIITADQAGDTNYNIAPQVTLIIPVSVPIGATVPGAPTGVTATLGNTSNEVIVTIGATDSGGSSITGYTVASHPKGIVETGTASPITVTCPSACVDYAFSVIATNAIGDSTPSTQAEVITAYKVFETIHEPDTQPRNSIFIGSFTFNSTTRTVSKLQGILSESMTGDTIAYPDDNMNWLSLTHQLSSVYDPELGGLLVTTFLNSDTNTLSTTWGGDGWAPGSGFGLYYTFPEPTNPGNAYAMIFVNPLDPTAPLTQAQIDKLAYADCSPSGMMGATCMTGTTVAGYGVIGTMSGFPVSQVITKQP